MVEPLLKFRVTGEHLALMKRLYISYNDWEEWGAPEVNPKRPYGNSDLFGDMGEILGVEPEEDAGYGESDYSEAQREHFMKLHKEMRTVLQILVLNNGVREGLYQAKKYIENWAPVEETPAAQGK